MRASEFTKQGVAEGSLNELAPSSGGRDDILKTLAAQWLHGDIASGDLSSDTQSQEKVERRLEKGVTCPDGVKRKLYIDYSDDYEGVVIYGDDDWSITYKQDDLSESKQGVAEDTQHNSQDLKDVAEWMKTTPDKLNIVVKQEPIEKFIKQIREMYSTYDEFLEDAERTDSILKLLKRGAKPLPMYVEANDPALFVMEGRHRMVAFWLAGMKTIPVAYVSVKDKQGVMEARIDEFYDEKANKPEGGKLDRLVRRSLSNKIPVFVLFDNKTTKSGYVQSEHPVKGFLVIGSGRKTYTTFNDQTQKATKDGNRVYIQPRSMWNSSRELDLDEGVTEDSLNEFAPNDDGDGSDQQPLKSFKEIATIIKTTLGAGWAIEHFRNPEKPEYIFMPIDETQHKTKNGMARIWSTFDPGQGENPVYWSSLYRDVYDGRGNKINRGEQAEVKKLKTATNALATARRIQDHYQRVSKLQEDNIQLPEGSKQQGVAESLLNENVTELYHGTLATNVDSILANGLNPTVGEFTRSIYANKAKPLVFAADINGSRAVYCSLVGQMHAKLGITKYPPSAEDVAQHCAILVISKDVGKFKQYNSKRRQGSKEPTDYTSEQTIHIDKILRGKELLQWVKTHGADRGEMCTIDNQQGVAEDSYREGGSITHDGVEYDFDRVMSIAEKLPTKTCSVDKLSWILKYDTPNKERLERADITVPLIVTKSSNGKLAAIDGLHRLAKAVRDNVKTVKVKYIKSIDLESAKLNRQGVAEDSEDPSYKKGWELCNKDPSADPQHLFRRHGEGLDRNQFIKGFNDNAKLRGMSIYGDVRGDVDHSTLRYKEFKRDQGVAEDTLNEFSTGGDDDNRPRRSMLLADVAKIIRAKLGPGWTMEHVGRTEQPGYKFIPTDKTKHGMAKIWCLVDWDKVGEYPTYNTILYSFQNENGRLMAHGKQTERAKPKTVANALQTAQIILSNTDGALKDNVTEDIMDEIKYSNRISNSSHIVNALKPDNSSKIGVVDHHTVYRLTASDCYIYYLYDDVKDIPLAYIITEKDKEGDYYSFRQAEKLVDTPGVAMALLQFLRHKGVKLVVRSDEPVTLKGITWLTKMIEKPRGLNIHDGSGKPVNLQALWDEWNKSHEDYEHNGVVSIFIESSGKSAADYCFEDQTNYRGLLMNPLRYIGDIELY